MWSVDPLDFFPTLVVALCASFHCVGMCGGYAVAACVGCVGRAGTLRGQILYHLGKTTTYLFLGALAGWFGVFVTRWDTTPARVLATVAGVFLIVVGVFNLGLVTLPGSGRKAPLGWSRWGRALSTMQSRLAPLYLGVFSGLLPCPLVYAFLARAASSGGYLDALLTMAALGLGTVPVLVVVATTGSLFGPVFRSRLLKVSGVLMILLGIWTWHRGWTAPCCAGEHPGSEAPAVRVGVAR